MASNKEERLRDPLSFNEAAEQGNDDIQLFEEVPRHEDDSKAPEGEPSRSTSRFAFDARIDDAAAIPDDDPLSAALRSSSFGGASGGGGDPLSRHADPLSGGGGGADDEDGATTRIDMFASYGQLLTDDYVRNGSSHLDQDEEDSVFRRTSDQQEQQSRGGEDEELLSPPEQRFSRDTPDAGVAAPATPSRRRIRVSDPVKKVESSLLGLKSGHVLYKVDMQDLDTDRAASARRRFRDFVALADLLKATHRGYFLPPRPDKQPNPLESKVPDSEFVASRAAALESWLQQLSAHPVIGHSQELRLFLETEGQLASDPAWMHLHPAQAGVLDGVARLPRQLLGQERAVPLPSEAAQSTGAAGDLLRRYKEARTGLRNHPPPSESELDLMAIKEKLEDWQTVLADASRRAEALAFAFEDAGARTGDVGMALIKLARFQEDDASSSLGRYTPAGSAANSIAAHALPAGKAAVVVARVAKAAAAPVTKALGPLHDALAMAPAAIKALRQREAALLTAQALHDEAETKAATISHLEVEGSKVFGSDRGKARKAQALTEEVKALRSAEVAANEEYDRVRGRNVEELARWQEAQAEAFARMLSGLANVQYEFNKRSANVWQAVAADLAQKGGGAGPSH